MEATGNGPPEWNHLFAPGIDTPGCQPMVDVTAAQGSKRPGQPADQEIPPGKVPRADEDLVDLKLLIGRMNEAQLGQQAMLKSLCDAQAM